MRRTILVVAFLSALIGFNSVFAQKEIFIKQIEFKLERVSEVDYENEYFMTSVLHGTVIAR